MAINNCFYIKNTGSDPITIANHPADNSTYGFDYSINNMTNWTIGVTTENITLNPGDKVYFKGDRTFANADPLWVFQASSDWFQLIKLIPPEPPSPMFELSMEIGGSVMSLIHDGDGDNETPKQLDEDPNLHWTFSNMFENGVGGLDISNLKLPSTVLCCYFKSMFANAHGLREIPSNLLPATVLSKNCYNSMFCGTGISAVPEGLLPAKELVDNCYQQMFSDCPALSQITVPFTDWKYGIGTNAWVENVPSMGVFHCRRKLPLIYDMHHIPNGWTVEYIDKIKKPFSATFLNKVKTGGRTV